MRNAGPSCPFYVFLPLGLCFFLVCTWTFQFTQNLLEHLHGAPVLTGRVAEDILNQALFKDFIVCADKQTRENLAFQRSITSWLWERPKNVLMSSEYDQGSRTRGQANVVRWTMLSHWCKWLICKEAFLCKPMKWVHSYFLVKSVTFYNKALHFLNFCHKTWTKFFK